MRYIPSDIANKIKESEQTIYNDAEPRMEVDIARAKLSVIDSDYWTVEEIREKPGLGDIAVASRRFYSNHGRPDRLYEIHVDNGVVKTAIREFPDLQKTGWQDQFELGNGTDVEITFDGGWETYRKNWRFRTDEAPWLFWITDTGNLMAQLWDDTSTLVQLSTGVEKMSTIRGWKNFTIDADDQGIVVAYVLTDGTAFYRNYCRQGDGTTTWETEREITNFTGTAKDISLSITIDYRLAILIENTIGDIYWLVTVRNWSGMAIEEPHINSAITDLNLEVLQVTYYDSYENENITTGISDIIIDILYASSYNSFIDLENVADEFDDWGRIINIEVKHELFSTPTISIYDIADSQELPVGSITMTDSTHITVEIDIASEIGMNNSEDVTVTLSNTLNEAGYSFDTFNETFTPINLVPVAIPLPIVMEVWNE